MHDYIARTVSPEDLARLKADREAADARYNAALTAVDRAVQRGARRCRTRRPAPTSTRSRRSTSRWEILERRPGRCRDGVAAPPRFIWRVLEPALGAQQRFNSAVVDHVNRNIPRERAVPQAIDATIGLVKAQLEAAIRFQSALIVYLQTVTPFVDTKDYEFAGLGRRAAEDAANSAARLDEVTRGFAGGLSGLSDEVLKRYEALTVARSAPRPGRRRAAHGGRRGAALDRGGAADPRSHRRPGALAGRRAGGGRGVPGAGSRPRPATAGPGPGAQPSVRRVRGSLPRLRGRDPRADGRLRRAVRRRHRCPRRRLRARRVPRAAARRRHSRPRRGPQHRNGRAMPRQGPRRRPAATRLPTSRSCPTPAWAGSSPARWSSTSSPTTCCASSSWPRGGCGPAASSSSRPSTRRRGLRSSRATSAISPTSGRCTPTRCATCSSPTASSRPRSCGARRPRNPPGCSMPAGRAARGDAALDAVVRTVDRNVDRLNGLMFGPRDFAAIARRP